ncbi:glutamate mutase L [Phytohabitans kaempferiae]|uniref:Glutamate mutase L n=1 Tax=Phytohabitans kaempferiae TaxID=1620943 RepID=A0ABV6MB52_9ACTN
MRAPQQSRALAVCADVGSTYTKVAVVDVDDGTLVATAGHPTTAGTDVMAGLGAAVTAATAGLGPVSPSWYVCSSAGGGLRLAVVGYERLVTAEAGHRVGLSAGARVVHVAAGPLSAAGVRELRAARPDVVLLVGGTDGGDREVLEHNARRLARWRTPVVVAGNADARDEVAAVLSGATIVDNVLPRIGVLAPGPARAAIREVFLRHVIGGKFGRRFARLVRAATPDAVLAGVELLADHTGRGLLVVDVGGATTDVYSALPPGAERGTDAAGTLARARTVEGDLGVRWSAPGVVAAAAVEKLPHDAALPDAARRRAADPAMLSGDSATGEDVALATLAATVAVRRHARGEAGGFGRRDLTDVSLVVGSGGVLRHAPAGDAQRVLDAVRSDHGGGWPVPRAATTVVDREYVLAAGGLLAADHPAAALALLRHHLCVG